MKTVGPQKIFNGAASALFWVMLLGLAPNAFAQRQQLHGHVPPAVAHLASTGRLATTTNLHLSIGLPLRNQDQLGVLLRQLYDPTSPNFRHYLTPEQFTAHFGPTPDDYQRVATFATANGMKIRGTHPNRVLLDVESSVANIEKAFHVTLRTYRHPTEARTFHAPDTEPVLDTAAPILDISGLDNYAVPRPMSHPQPLSQLTPALTGGGVGGSYIASDLRAAYVPGTALDGSGQCVGLLQFDGYYSNDIASYISQCGITTSVILTNVAVNGGIGTPGSGNSEVCLDIQMAIAMAPGLDKIFVYECPNNTSYWNTLLSRMANDNAAKQLSSSWSGGSSLNATGEQIFQQMAAQGQSFFCASGDCDAFNGANNANGFPTESTNITIVGGTTLLTTGPGGARSGEGVWNQITTNTAHGYWGSSGGISGNFGLPYFQQGVSMSNNQGSTTMRNVPDVALTAQNIFGVANNGTNYFFSGTSCAAPLWAGFTALVNQQAAAQGVPPPGFLNPILYNLGRSSRYHSCMNDIIAGNNAWPAGMPANLTNKFYAVSGYDLCTGWGTPNGTNLINYLLGPQVLAAVPANCSAAGGITITIQGSDLGAGDVTAVTLCGVTATIISDNSPTQVVVTSGATVSPGTGDVTVVSASAGSNTLYSGFIYTPVAPTLLAATNTTLSSCWLNWIAVSGATNYMLDVSLNSNFANYLAGYSNLVIGNVTTYYLGGLLANTNYYFRLRTMQAGMVSDYSSTGSVATVACSLSGSGGPYVGGMLLTISGVGLGNGSDIVSVTVCGLAASIQSQTADSVTVLLAAGGQGKGDVVIQSTSQGTTTLKNAFTYHAAGNIFGGFSGWTSTNSLPATRGYLGGAAAGGKIYAVGGNSGSSYLNTVLAFDPAHPSSGWTSTSNLPSARAYLGVAELGGKIYAVGGYDGTSYLNTAYVFDPAQASAGWTGIGNLPTNSGYLAAASLNGKLYALGGYNGSSYLNTAYVFDPAQPAAGWASISNLPTAVRALSAASADGRLYAIGGYNGSNQNVVYAYDPLQPTAGWSSVSNLPYGLYFSSVVGLNGKVHLMDGYYVTYINFYYTLDPAQSSGWVASSNTPLVVRGLAAACNGNTIYLMGGVRNGGTYVNYVYQGTYASGVAPATNALAGGASITITGNNLGAGDVTNVTLCGVAATVLADNSPTQLIVRAGAATLGGTGDVVIMSATYGTTTKSNGFVYETTVSLAAHPANAGTVTGGGTFVPGTNIQISATASNGWGFVAWNDGNTNTPRTIAVPPTNIVYTANFGTPVTLTVLANPTNAGRVSGGGSYYSGASATLTAQASNLWLFSSWNDGSTTTPYPITVPATNTSYTANFSPLLATNGVPAWWLNQFFGATNNFDTLALADSDSTGLANWQKYFADLNPTNPASRLDLLGVAVLTNDVFVTWIGGTNAWQVLQCNDDLTASNAWFDLCTNAPPTPVTNVFLHTGAGAATNLFYRLKAWR